MTNTHGDKPQNIKPIEWTQYEPATHERIQHDEYPAVGYIREKGTTWSYNG